ncbi:MAG: homoserine kinase [Polyangiaceae bacterium]
MKRASVFAPATIGNVGPGFDVLGLSIADLGDVVSFDPSAAWEVGEVTGLDAASVPRDPAKNASCLAARAMLRLHGIDACGRLSVERSLPISGGLGGSAAASVGGALAAALAFGITPTRGALFAASLVGESAVAGAHLDNIAPCVMGGLTLVRDASVPDVIAVPLTRDYFLALVTPDQTLETKTSRGVLPNESARGEWIAQMANTSALCVAFATGDSDLLRRALVDVFAEPRRASLITNFARMKKAALDGGALGCSISGAGPTLFAICESEAVARDVVSAIAAAAPSPPKASFVRAIDRLGARPADGKREGEPTS